MPKNTKTSHYSSPESTGMIKLDNGSQRVKILTSELGESTLKNLLKKSQGLIITTESGGIVSRQSVTQWAPVKAGTPLSPSLPPSLWSLLHKLCNGEGGRHAELSDTARNMHRAALDVTGLISYRTLTPLQRGILATLILTAESTNLTRTEMEVMFSILASMINDSGNLTPMNLDGILRGQF